MKDNVAFDLDGVLYNFVDPAYRELVMYHGVTLPQEEFWMNADKLFPTSFWDNFLGIEILYSKSKARPGIVSTVAKLAELYNIYYITNRPKNCYLVTKNWLKREGFPQYENLFLTDDKTKILQSIPFVFFVEDRPKDEYTKYTQVILKKTPWNKDKWTLYSTINDVSELIK